MEEFRKAHGYLKIKNAEKLAQVYSKLEDKCDEIRFEHDLKEIYLNKVKKYKDKRKGQTDY
jgi:hypothetical protein